MERIPCRFVGLDKQEGLIVPIVKTAKGKEVWSPRRHDMVNRDAYERALDGMMDSVLMEAFSA